MTFLALALSLVLVRAPEPTPLPDVWIAFAGDIRVDAPTHARLRAATGPAAQADVAVYVAAQQAAADTGVALDAVGFDEQVTTGVAKVARRDLPGGCVAIVSGPLEGVQAAVATRDLASCYVIVVLGWSKTTAEGMPMRVEREQAERLVTAGADAIVGHQAGTFGGVGWKGEAPIIWNVGSLFAPDVDAGGIFRVRLAPSADGYVLREVDMKPVAHDVGKQILRAPKEKDVGVIATTIAKRSKSVGGRATLEAAHIVFRPR